MVIFVVLRTKVINQTLVCCAFLKKMIFRQPYWPLTFLKKLSYFDLTPVRFDIWGDFLMWALSVKYTRTN